jgi:hypothetical protein
MKRFHIRPFAKDKIPHLRETLQLGIVSSKGLKNRLNFVSRVMYNESGKGSM